MINPVLAVYVVFLIAVPVIVYRKTHDYKKVALTVVALLIAWWVLGLVAHQFME